MSVLSPRRAKAAPRLTAVVVFPTPPFWLTTARTTPTGLRFGVGVVGLRGVAARDHVERLPRVAHPAIGLGALGRLAQEALEVVHGALHVVALEQQEGEAVVRARERRLEVERALVGADRLVVAPRLRVGDRHVLEDAKV